jgi:hypothetical protein
MIRRNKCKIAIDKVLEINQLLTKDFEDFDFDSIPDPY